jgi:hypothetical protein
MAIQATMLLTMNIYCQHRVTINYTSQQRSRNIYKSNRFACVTATLSQPRNLKNPLRNFLKWIALSIEWP